jgi:hypothetical protein
MIAGPHYQNYAKCMEEIKRRQLAVDDILQSRRTTTFRYTNTEFVALQFRKIFELVILASIASHRHFFVGLVRKLAKEWQISKIVVIVQKKNPNFYPKPIDRIANSAPDIKDEWLDVTSGYLTLDELVEAHGRIGSLMHANNPFREEPLLNEIEEMFPIWREKLIRLLNNHTIRFPGDESILYVGMQSAETGAVHLNLFAKTQR